MGLEFHKGGFKGKIYHTNLMTLSLIKKITKLDHKLTAKINDGSVGASEGGFLSLITMLKRNRKVIK